MSSLEIRPVRSSDAAELADLINALIAIGGTTALEDPFTPEQLDHTYLTGPEVFCCNVAVDRETGRLEGFQTIVREISFEEGWADIGTWARVDGKQRGVGSALFEAGCERARELGLTTLIATIRADNTGGLIFYDKLGFDDCGVLKGETLKDGTPVDKIQRRYSLQPLSIATSLSAGSQMNA